jgi:hypothetical protein
LFGGGVLIGRSQGIFRTFVIAPDKQDEFIKELNLKLAALLLLEPAKIPSDISL